VIKKVKVPKEPIHCLVPTFKNQCFNAPNLYECWNMICLPSKKENDEMIKCAHDAKSCWEYRLLHRDIFDSHASDVRLSQMLTRYSCVVMCRHGSHVFLQSCLTMVVMSLHQRDSVLEKML